MPSDATPYDMMQARAFCAVEGLPETMAPRVAALIANIRSETRAACAEKASRALDDVWAQLCRPLLVSGGG